MRTGLRTLAVLFSMAIAPLSVPALEAQSGPPSGGQPGKMGRGRDEMMQREQLERRFQERLDEIVKQRLNLSDELHAKLREVASRTEESRRQLRRDEMTVRMAMRRELMAGDKASEAKVGELLDQMPGLERRRLDLMEREQKELAKFLSPIQRVRYFGLQEELRRGMQEMQRRRMGMDDSSKTRVPRDSEAPRKRDPGDR
jgi:Spy/CpxP family protein refolding chaperone